MISWSLAGRVAPLATAVALLALGGTPHMRWSDPRSDWDALVVGPRDEVRLVVRDASLWREVWAGFVRNQEPPVPAPEVDFSETMFLIVGRGERDSGGYGVEFVNIEEREHEIVAEFRETDPEPGTLVTWAVTYPIALAAIPVADKPVRFVGRLRESE